MSIKEATPEEIQALKARISKRQLDRLYEAQMDEVVRMVGKRPFVAAQTSRKPHKEIPMEAAIVATGATAIAGAAALLGNMGAIPMSYAAITTVAGISMAAGQVIRHVL